MVLNYFKHHSVDIVHVAYSASPDGLFVFVLFLVSLGSFYVLLCRLACDDLRFELLVRDRAAYLAGSRYVRVGGSRVMLTCGLSLCTCTSEHPDIWCQRLLRGLGKSQ